MARAAETEIVYVERRLQALARLGVQSVEPTMWLLIIALAIVFAFVVGQRNRPTREWRLLEDSVEITLEKGCQFRIAYTQFRSVTRLRQGPNKANVAIKTHEPILIPTRRGAAISRPGIQAIFLDVDEFIVVMRAMGIPEEGEG
jgi:hypothetical protein